MLQYRVDDQGGPQPPKWSEPKPEEAPKPEEEKKEEPTEPEKLQ